MMLGHNLITKQCPYPGEKVKFVLAEEMCEYIGKEIYVAITTDPYKQTPIVMLSTEGGSNVEERIKES